MLNVQVIAHFERPGYIADPYWPALAKLIDIQKQSGVNRARSSANRRKALEEHLQAKGLTIAEYEALEKASKEPFYRGNNGEIIIPENQVMSFLVATCDEIRAASRPAEPNQVKPICGVAVAHRQVQARRSVGALCDRVGWHRAEAFQSTRLAAVSLYRKV